VIAATNLSWNGSVAAHASTTFGLLASGTSTAPLMTCTAT